MAQISVRTAAGDDPLLERLWLMFRHDMSGINGGLPDADGMFGAERFAAATNHTGWARYTAHRGEHPVGLAFVRNLDAPARVMNAFFVVRGARRDGVGLGFAREVLRRHPGRWEIPFQDRNAGAVAFWRRLAAEVAGEAWNEEHRPVPHRPDVPPDTWICFTQPG